MGGDPGTPGDGTDTKDFIDALNNAHFGDYSDWRLPTIKELAYLVDFSISSPGPTINTTYFPNTVTSFYRSSTTDAYHTHRTWLVWFYFGESSWGGKLFPYYVRAVRGGQPGSSGYFVEPSGTCGSKKPCYSTIQAALNAAGDGAVIKVADGNYPEAPVWSTTGTVTISGGWNSTFTGQTGTTEMYAPRATGGGGVKLQPKVNVVPPQ